MKMKILDLKRGSACVGGGGGGGGGGEGETKQCHEETSRICTRQSLQIVVCLPQLDRTPKGNKASRFAVQHYHSVRDFFVRDSNTPWVLISQVWSFCD